MPVILTCVSLTPAKLESLQVYAGLSFAVCYIELMTYLLLATSRLLAVMKTHHCLPILAKHRSGLTRPQPDLVVSQASTCTKSVNSVCVQVISKQTRKTVDTSYAKRSGRIFTHTRVQNAGDYRAEALYLKISG